MRWLRKQGKASKPKMTRDEAETFELGGEKFSITTGAGVADGLLNAGTDLHYKGQPQEALIRYEGALKAFRALGYADKEAMATCSMAQAYRDMGQPQTALALLSQAATMLERIGNLTIRQKLEELIASTRRTMN